MENDTRTSYGIELFANKNGSDNSHGIPVEEIGYTLSADLFYEKDLGHIAECYSEDFCVGQCGVGGGDDETPERIEIPGSSTQTAEWSMMGETGDPIGSHSETYRYSIEELLTIDFDEIPSTDG